jgi:hypothetical protein
MQDVQDLEVGRCGGGSTLNGEGTWNSDKAADVLEGTCSLGGGRDGGGIDKKIPSFTSNVDSRTRPNWISSLRCLLISWSISGVMASAQIEDPAGGESLIPRHKRPWTV